ncbi:MAG: GFA family protein [Neptuniibacter sp.]
MNYSGSCHCGAVKFHFTAHTIADGLRCNCSICLKKGALMSNFFIAPEDLKIEAPEEVLSSYQFATHVAKHYFCNRCGIYTFHETKRKPGYYRVNLGCVDGIDSLSLPVVLADGAAF